MAAAAARVRSRVAEDADFVPRPRPRNDVYTILLAISLVAMLAGSLLLYLDYSSYGAKKPPDVPKPALK